MFQNLISGWVLVPNGNCRHGAQSSCVINQEHISVRHDYVVGEFILGDYLSDVARVNFVLRFSSGPLQHFLESGMTLYLLS
jgi:hypothetical protein